MRFRRGHSPPPQSEHPHQLHYVSYWVVKKIPQPSIETGCWSDAALIGNHTLLLSFNNWQPSFLSKTHSGSHQPLTSTTALVQCRINVADVDPTLNPRSASDLSIGASCVFTLLAFNHCSYREVVLLPVTTLPRSLAFRLLSRVSHRRLARAARGLLLSCLEILTSEKCPREISTTPQSTREITWFQLLRIRTYFFAFPLTSL